MTKFPIGIQTFSEIRDKGFIYVDKTAHIYRLTHSTKCFFLSRPRRFGKTLNMTMLKAFFSLDYKGRGELFKGLSIWQEEKYRKLQGTYPVISLSFARIKEKDYEKSN